VLRKPSHLSGDYGAWFKDPLLVASYPSRPPYPAGVFALLSHLAVDAPLDVLDVGCGTGDVARRLAQLVDHIDAVDFSPAMIELGQRLPGGNAANLRWILAPAETAPLAEHYALVTAGESLHWMDWPVVLPRFASVLSEHGMLAIVERRWDNEPALRERMQPIIRQFTPVRDYQPYNLADEIESRGLFQRAGEEQFGPDPWTPTIEDYLECRHSQRGFSRTHMGPEAVAGFDDAVRELLEACCREGAIDLHDDRLQLSVVARVIWGRPALH
jgi:SAM-dependent methyltransferase